MDREKILEAMKTLKAVCEEGECSNRCPFYYKNKCYITYHAPVLWKTNEPEPWKAYKEE